MDPAAISCGTVVLHNTVFHLQPGAALHSYPASNAGSRMVVPDRHGFHGGYICAGPEFDTTRIICRSIVLDYCVFHLKCAGG